LYGYANGDPINNSDPFGLCPEWLTKIPCGLKFSGVQTNFVVGNREWSVTIGKWETASETGQFVTFGKPLAGGFPALGSKTPAIQYVEGGSESVDTFVGNAMEVSAGGSYGVATGSLSLTMIPGRGVPVGYTIGVGVTSPTTPSVTPTATRTTISGKRTKDGSVIEP
jgi:hypothetical protein